MTSSAPIYNFEYVPEYQVLLTKRCAFTCGYCNFPESASPPLPSPKQFRSFLRTAQRVGAHQVTLVSGEGLDQLREIHTAVKYFGFSSWWEYIAHLCMLTAEAKGSQPLLAVLEVGAIPNPEIAYLQPFVGALRLVLDYKRKEFYDGGILKDAQQKNPLIRHHAVRAMARAGVPLMLGARIGIGETREDHVALAEQVTHLHEQYGSVHSFHLIPFAPVPRSLMSEEAPVSDLAFRDAAVIFRENLPATITICAEISTRLPLMPRIAASGILDLGAFNLGTNGSIALDARQHLAEISTVLAKMGIVAKPRALLRPIFRDHHRLAPKVENQIKRFESKLLHGDVEPDGADESAQVILQEENQ